MRKIFLNLKERVWYLIIPVFVMVAFLERGFVASSDSTSTWFSPFYNLKQLLFVWDTYSQPGGYSPNNITPFFLRLYYSVIEIFTTNPEFIQKAAWIAFFSFFGIVIFRIINKNFLKNKLSSFAAVLFIFFNPVSQYFLWRYQAWSYYLVAPCFIGVYLYLKYIETKNVRFLFLIASLWFVFGFVFCQPAGFVSFAFILVFLFVGAFFKERDRKRFIYDHLKFFIFFLLLNCVYILPLLYGGFATMAKTRSVYAGGIQLPILQDLKFLNFFFSFINTANGYGNFFLNNNPYFLCIWTAFFVVIFYVYFFKKNELRENGHFFFFSILIVALLFFIFLNKGITRPFPGLSEKIYSINVMYIFRSFKDKLAVGFSTLLSFLFILLFKTKNKYLAIFLVFISISSYVTFVGNSWLPPDFVFSDNLDYLRPAKAEVGDNLKNRILNLPLVDYSFFFTDQPHYSGDNPMKNIFHKEVLYGSMFLKNIDTELIKDKLADATLTANAFYEYLKEHNIRYIINNKNSFAGGEPIPYAYDYKVLSNYPALLKIHDTPSFELYRFDDYYPLISAEGSSFQEINPSKFRIYLSHVSGATALNYLDSFDSRWNLYLEKGSTDSWCDPVKYYKNSETTECLHKQKFLGDDELSFLRRDPVFDDTHKQIYGYANGWTIDPNYIKQHFSKDYYIENPDGSINIEFILYFQPQSYFYLGLLVTFTTLLGCLGYIGWEMVKRKRGRLYS